ncbi:MAG: hypothetical protein ACLUSV_03330 [Streptococcus sp.]
MKLRFRILIGICFLIGVGIYGSKELLYALAFLLVGGFYIYKEELMVHLVLEVKDLTFGLRRIDLLLVTLILLLEQYYYWSGRKNGSGKTTLIKSLSSVFDKRNYQVTSSA